MTKETKRRKSNFENIIIFKEIINNPLIDLFYLKYRYRKIFYLNWNWNPKINLILIDKFLLQIIINRKKKKIYYNFIRDILKNYKIRIMEVNAE